MAGAVPQRNIVVELIPDRPIGACLAAVHDDLRYEAVTKACALARISVQPYNARGRVCDPGRVASMGAAGQLAGSNFPTHPPAEGDGRLRM